MNALADVKSYMNFWGWTNHGGPGGVKHDVEGRVIARHGDATWIKDVDEACATLDRIHKRATEQRTKD